MDFVVRLMLLEVVKSVKLVQLLVPLLVAADLHLRQSVWALHIENAKGAAAVLSA